jgi:3-(3-hydroxy-phenyl)propionate hydroxylase
MPPAQPEAESTTANYDTEVAVVGAGPIGLTLACALAHHGVRFRLFEKQTEPAKYSKANNLWARPQELLAAIGVREALAEKSYAVTDANVVINGKTLQQQGSDAVSPYAAVRYSGQDVIQTTLAELLERQGHEVERGRTVLSVGQDDDGVTLVVGDDRDPDDQQGQGEQVRARYVVGADGISGLLRDELRLSVETEKFEDRATRMVDARLTWRRPKDPDQMWFFTYHAGFAGVMPVWGGYHRLFLLEDEAVVPDRDPTLEEMQQRLREVTGDVTATLADPIWFSHGTFRHGTAASYGEGRIFLAGDAGHNTLPIGGQGMNAGVHDVVGLAWRLAMTLAGAAGAQVLDSYSSERQRAHAELDAQQARWFRQLMYRNRAEDLLLKGAVATVPDLASRIFGGGDLDQLGVAYPDSVLSSDQLSHLRTDRRIAPAGHRAPDAPVVDEDGRRVTLFSQIYNPDGHSWGWSLLAFDGGQASTHPSLVATLAVALPEWVRPRLVVADPATPTASTAGVPRLFDLDLHAHAAYGLQGTPALVLVRPDGHIAFRGRADDADVLQRYLQNLTGTNATAA